ncbi:MAG: O-acetyl-ADP-ribose deacetylase [Candidatus Krumholzibacteria bacterium]|nr:O-acetyl-ADP-ribose deacetylase [Candidatus Krumholzibacteria bacterium]
MYTYQVGEALVRLLQGDITQQDTDAIVNAANSTLLGGGGVDGAIHRAGGPAILAECKKIVAKIGQCDTGEAVITTGGNLRARHVIHTVGPVYHGGQRGEPELLANAYKNSYRLAVENGLKSIAFPSISTGVYGYPIEKASRIALQTIYTLLKDDGGMDEVRFVLFSDKDLDVYRQTARDV